MISPIEEVAQLFIRKAEGSEDVLERPTAFSVRSPVSRLAYIDAMAVCAGGSRNEMANELLRVGIWSVLERLPVDVRAEIEQVVIEKLGDDAPGVRPL